MEDELATQFPIKVEVRPGRGRCVIAKEDIPAGGIIMQAAPVAWMALPLAQVCWACLKAPAAGKAALSRCGGCDLFRYCDRACQKSDWATAHKQECKLLRGFFAGLGQSGERLDSTDLASALLLHRVLRSAWVRSSDVPGPAFTRPAGGGAGAPAVYIHSLADLARMERETRPAQLEAVGGVVKLAERMGLLALPVPPELAACGASIKEVATAVASSFDRNNFGVTDDLLTTVGMGVFPAGALLNHSCAPNACVSYEWMPPATSATSAPPRPAVLQTIRALCPIPAGTEVCHTFTEIARPLAERRKHLEGIYGFTCDCAACTAEEQEGYLNPLTASVASALLGPAETLPPRLSGADPLSEEEARLQLSAFVRLCQDRLRAAAAGSSGAVAAAAALQCGSLAGGTPPPAAKAGAATVLQFGETAPALIAAAVLLVQLIEARATSTAILQVGATAGFRAPTDAELAGQQQQAGGGLLVSQVCPRVTGADAAEVVAEVSALECCLSVLRWEAAPCHLDVVQVAQALLSRYLLMDEAVPATLAACYLAEWYETAYPRTPAHPMRALQMFTAADLLVETGQRTALAAEAPPKKAAPPAAGSKKKAAAAGDEAPEPAEVFLSPARLSFLAALFPSRAAAAFVPAPALATPAWRQATLQSARSVYEACRRILSLSRGPRSELAAAASDKLREVNAALAAEAGAAAGKAL